MIRRLLDTVLALSLALITTSVMGQFYNGMHQEFGKNRIQYRDFLWKYYKFEQYDVYFYEGGEDLAEYTGRVARNHIDQMEETFDNSFDGRIQIIVYRTQSEFEQSNIGLSYTQDYNIGGTTRIVGNKVFTFFEGDYNTYQKNLRRGIAEVLLADLLYGGNWSEVIKNSTLLNLPTWFTQGMVRYASGDWTPEEESRAWSGVLSGEFENFNHLEGETAEIAGEALWRYIDDVYDKKVIPNILYMSRISTNVESGFLFVLGKSVETITRDFNEYYKNRVKKIGNNKQPIPESLPIKTKDRRWYYNFKVSPDGKYAAYTSNELGQYRVYLYDIERDKRKKVFKADHKLDRIIDRSYPVIAWHPSGRSFSFVTEWRGKLMLNNYDVTENEVTQQELYVMDKVLDMDYAPDGRRMVFSGVLNGQTDLYLYYALGNRQERLTNDMYDELQPSFTLDGNGIIFTSNRTNDTLTVKNVGLDRSRPHDVFIYDVASRSPVLERVTRTPQTHERDPASYDKSQYTYLADYKGTINRYLASLDSAISRVDTTIHYRYFTRSKPITNYDRHILNYEMNPKSGTYATTFYGEDGYVFSVGDVRDDKSLEDQALESSDKAKRKAPGGDVSYAETRGRRVKPDFIVPIEKPAKEVDIENYRFKDEQDFSYKRSTVVISEAQETQGNQDSSGVEGAEPVDKEAKVADEFKAPNARNYNVNYTADHAQLSIDNSYRNNFYQRISGGQNLNPGIGGMMKVGAVDLFEDYRLLGGFRLSGNLDNTLYFLAYEDLKDRLDKRYWGQRQMQRTVNGFDVSELVTYSGGAEYSWPFNEVMRVSGELKFRYDQQNILANDDVSLNEEGGDQLYTGIKAAFVFDNTLPRGINLYQGHRAKLWGEYYRDPEQENTSFMVFGFDYRNYIRVHRSLTWANRLAGSTSLGQERLAYFLGGVDNWLFPQTDNSLPLDPEQNYAFQTMATPMRGFYYNARNGNSMAVASTEIRWPIFKYFMKRPIKSDFIENFQIVGFADAGSAWTGTTPYDEDNFFNTQTVRRGGITVEVENNRDPVVYGYGFGVRSRLLGYFLKLDYAWGVDDGIILDPVIHFSLGLDF